MEKEKPTEIFLNGKAQMIEMFKYLNPKEKQVLLKNIRARSPQLANELQGQGITFHDIITLEESKLRSIARSIHPSIMGMALKDLGQNSQKEILSKLSREYAEKVFEALLNNHSDETRLIEKSKARITELMMTPTKRF